MSTRVPVTLRPEADVEQVVAELTGLGAGEIQPPRPELSAVCIATVDEDRHPPDAWAERARLLPGVAEAEVDQLRWSM